MYGLSDGLRRIVNSKFLTAGRDKRIVDEESRRLSVTAPIRQVDIDTSHFLLGFHVFSRVWPKRLIHSESHKL